MFRERTRPSIPEDMCTNAPIRSLHVLCCRRPGGAALDINVGSGPVTILGNIVTGGTVLNGAALPPNSPWIPVNVEV